MHFGSISIVAESPNFMNFRLTPANTPDKFKSVIGPTIRVGRFVNGSGWRVSRRGVEVVTVEIASEANAYSDYILKITLKL